MSESDSAPRQLIVSKLPRAIQYLQGTTLAQKGTWVLAALVAYLVVATMVTAFERQYLYDAITQLESIHSQEERQLSLNIAVSHAIVTVNEHYFSLDVSASARILAVELDGVIATLRVVQKNYAPVADHVLALERISRELAIAPKRATIAELRAAFHRLVLVLDTMTSAIRERKQAVLAGYRSTYTRAMSEWLAIVVLGVAAFGGIGVLFFRRLAHDIVQVKSRAIEIVRGYRGEPLPVTRRDELGDLLKAVNQMQGELRAREVQLELGRQQRFHQEKMAAVGSLAAAVAHEINNPLAAIVGIAESIAAESANRHCAEGGAPCQPQPILEQARRVMAITRQISDFSLQRPAEPELLDVNTLIRSTCTFIAYDKRFRGVSLLQDLGGNLPAVFAVSDHVVQVLMNVLINAADATEGRRMAGAEVIITVSSRLDNGQVVISVSDNGSGITPEDLSKVFDEYFTTKPAGRGTGLGLSLCRRLIQTGGGDIQLESVAGQGTTVRVSVPVWTESTEV